MRAAPIPEVADMRSRIDRLRRDRNINLRKFVTGLQDEGEDIHYSSAYRFLQGRDMAYGRVALLYNALLQARPATRANKVERIMLRWRHVECLGEPADRDAVEAARDQEISFLPLVDRGVVIDLLNVSKALAMDTGFAERPGPAWRGRPPVHISPHATVQDAMDALEKGERFLLVGTPTNPVGMVAPFSLLAVQD